MRSSCETPAGAWLALACAFVVKAFRHRRIYSWCGVLGFTLLLAQLADVRKQGYAVPQTLEPQGIRTLGVTLDRDQAAIGLAGRFPDRRIPTILRRLEKVARTIDAA